MEDVFYDVQILTSKRKVVIIITRLSIDSIGLRVYRSGTIFKSFRSTALPGAGNHWRRVLTT